jgi:hypothetical protein
MTGVGVQARARWRLGLTPAFSQQDAAGPFTTLVAFMPGPLAEEIASSVRRLPGVEGHIHYPPAQIHMTVRNLDGVELAELPDILSQAPALELRTGRLCFTPATLLLELVPTEPTLRIIRSKLDELSGASPFARARR